MLGLRDSGDDLLFIEGASGDIANREDQDMIITFADQFDALRSLALPQDDTSALITQRIDEINQREHHRAD